MEQIILDDSFLDSDLINHKGQKYPRIVIEDNQIVKPSVAPEHLADVFLVDDEHLFRRLFHQYRSKGFVSMLNLIKEIYMMQSLTDDDDDDARSNVDNVDGHGKSIEKTLKSTNYGLTILYTLAMIILYIRFLYLTVHFYFYPFDKYSDDELLREFNVNPDWKSGVLRSFVWHPNSLRCALALINDLIYVYAADDRRPMNHIVCLKNIHQKRISSMCWHPKRDDILVVACQRKILIWSLKSDLSTFKMDGQKCPQIIDALIESPITSIAFNGNGDQLVACSPRNSSLSLIKLADMPKIELIRNFFMPQFTSLIWSPDQTRLFAQTTTEKLCIFETIRWTHKFWPAPKEDAELCQTSVWSRPNGRILLFAPKKSSRIYALTFYDRAEAGDVGGDHNTRPIKVLDTRHHLCHDEPDQSNQCYIHQICWDSKSTRLAVSFQDRLDMVAIYATQLNPGLNIWPLCSLKSNFSNANIARCLLLSFHDNYMGPGSLLTVCWSNGFLTHIPLPKNEQNHDGEGVKSTPEQPETSIRSLTSLCYSFDDTFLSGDQSLYNGTTTPNRKALANGNGSLNHGTPNGFKKTIAPQSPDSRSSRLMVTPSSITTSCTPRRTTLFSTRVKFD